MEADNHIHKIAQLQETQKSDQAAVSQIPGDYYLTREQVAAIRHIRHLDIKD